MNTTAAKYPMSEWLAYKGRFVNASFMIKKGEEEYLIKIRDGQVINIKPGPHIMPRWTFALSASVEAWTFFWSSIPQPRYHDLMAMVKFKELKVEGDQTIFMSNLLYFKELVSQLGSAINAKQ